jgi:hypothetical protein
MPKFPFSSRPLSMPRTGSPWAAQLILSQHMAKDRDSPGPFSGRAVSAPIPRLLDASSERDPRRIVVSRSTSGSRPAGQ